MAYLKWAFLTFVEIQIICFSLEREILAHIAYEPFKK
jgi:hypothetical protein